MILKVPSNPNHSRISPTRLPLLHPEQARPAPGALPAWLMTRSALRSSSASESLKRKVSTAKAGLLRGSGSTAPRPTCSTSFWQPRLCSTCGGGRARRVPRAGTGAPDPAPRHRPSAPSPLPPHGPHNRPPQSLEGGTAPSAQAPG